jgi:4-amino-4-deoxy-L-arabinose transferase-like glycosyltransferase
MAPTQTAPQRAHDSAHTAPLWPCLALLVLAVGLYFSGLGSFYAPTNGDEMVYIHIARLTAESGHWLPLVSDLGQMRNTKPPLLFWQALVAGDWGAHWSLFALRLPSVVYTLLTAAAIAWFTQRLSGNWRTACLAAVIYLAFFSSFRFSRVYLTSAPETFWLALPMWALLWSQLRPPGVAASGPAWLARAAPWRAPAVLLWFGAFGLCMGLGLLYKSFALVAPAAAALWCALLAGEPWRLRHLLRSTVAVAWSTALALGVFALWFALDPDPAAVWQEFVVGENAGKMAGAQGYWHAALWGDYPLWTQLLAYCENAGLLFFVVLGLAGAGARAWFKGQPWAQATPAQRTLWLWLLVWLVVFSIPSQRSARYVIPAMPALAVLLALYWEQVARGWFLLTVLLTSAALVVLGRIAWVLGGMLGGEPLWRWAAMLAVGLGLAAGLVAWVARGWSRKATLLACLCVYATFGLMVAPLDASQAQYSALAAQHLTGKRVAVPNGFTAQYERFHFLMPNSTLAPYDTDGRNTGALHPELPPVERLDFLLQNFDAVVWIDSDSQATAPPCAPRCTALGYRWHVKSRHKSGEVTLANVWQPEQWLLGREWLLVPAH